MRLSAHCHQRSKASLQRKTRSALLIEIAGSLPMQFIDKPHPLQLGLNGSFATQSGQRERRPDVMEAVLRIADGIPSSLLISMISSC